MSVAVDPTGKFAHVTNSNSNDGWMYTVDATTGTLTSIGTIVVGLALTSIVIHPSGKFAYVTNSRQPSGCATPWDYRDPSKHVAHDYIAGGRRLTVVHCDSSERLGEHHSLLG
jgi:DNA-binding beta-propeller fold protein YncE